ncbi:hypothetical protein [Gimesia maris]|uniref:hypothetical protein n=1 Tax=Gimesia maris TaxID=122 RepID=UPI0012B994E2|nr:hypothetical protein [Gimesia maris]
MNKLIPGALMMSLILVSCGGKTPGTDKKMGSVKFSVTYSGDPVTQGTIQILADGGKAAGGELNDAGEVYLSEVETGNYTVCLAPPTARPNPEGGPPIMPKKAENVPDKYYSPETSHLKAEVKEGDNEFTFELKE